MARLAEGIVAAVFLAAGLLKVWDPPGFALSIARLQALPLPLVGAAAILLPWIELAGGAALLARGAWRSAGRAILAALLVVFTLALAAALLRGGASTCGCFGAEGGFLSRSDVGLARNLLLLGLLGLAFRKERAGPRPVPPG